MTISHSIFQNQPTKRHRPSEAPAFVSAKNNPFVVQRTAALEFDFRNSNVASKSDLLSRFHSSQGVGAILGRRGSGKTTLLRELQQDFLPTDFETKFVLVPREKELQQKPINDAIEASHRGCVVLVDGIERLSFWRRQSMIVACRSGAGFVATIHRRSLCLMPILIRCQTSPDLLCNLLRKLELDRPEIISAALPLWSEYRGNIRLVLRELYDQYSSGNFENF